MKVYLDSCCYNRLFDDRSYSQIYYERNSILLILEWAEQMTIQIIGSQMVAKEIADISDVFRFATLQIVYQELCSEEVQINNDILNRAEQIRHISNIKYKDSIHLACAEYINADVLLTTDRKFRNSSKRIKTFIKVMNPNEWLLEVLYK